jgi:glucose/arabinose dehydrogenase
VAAEGLQTPVGAVELPGGELMVSNIAGGISLVGQDGRARNIHGELRSPGRGIVADHEGAAAYVVDYGGTTVSRIDHDGGRVVVADGLSSPVGLARMPDGNLLVATWGANAKKARGPLRNHALLSKHPEVSSRNTEEPALPGLRCCPR